MPAARAAERHRQLGAHRAVRLAAREVESRRAVDRDHGRPVGHQALRQRQDVTTRRPRGARAEQRVDDHRGGGPRLVTTGLAHAVHPCERAVVDRIVGLGVERGHPNGDAARVQGARQHPPVATVVSGPRDDQRAAGEHRGILAHEQVRDSTPRALHEHPRGDAVLRAGGGVPRGRVRRGKYRERVHGITTPPYPTTAVSSPVTIPEWL